MVTDREDPRLPAGRGHWCWPESRGLETGQQDWGADTDTNRRPWPTWGTES